MHDRKYQFIICINKGSHECLAVEDDELVHVKITLSVSVYKYADK